MSLLQMSFSGAVMTLVILAIRALAINRLPKKTFSALWGIVLIRLLLPYSLPSGLNVYALLQNLVPAEAKDTKYTIPWLLLWLAGLSVCAAFFLLVYHRYRSIFRRAMPVHNRYTADWLNRHRLFRVVRIYQSGNISTPLTCGVFRPVILLPEATDWNDTSTLPYVLAHEYLHIRRFDAAKKLFLTAALCVHWFNPAVWFLYLFANRDIELSCDEAVICLFGEHARAAYAMALIHMEEVKSGFVPSCNYFSKNGTEERVVAIMKSKKPSVAARLAATCLIIGVTTAFATSAPAKQIDAPSYLDLHENTVLSFTDANTGETRCSQDGGNTWMPVTNPDELHHMEWWTYEEFAAWLEEQKEILPACVGCDNWTPATGWYTWEEDMIPESISKNEQILAEIGKGLKLSKPVQNDQLPDEAILQRRARRLSVYEQEGLQFDAATDQMYWNGERVRYFEDSYQQQNGCKVTVCCHWDGDGVVDIRTVRETQEPYTLKGVEEYVETKHPKLLEISARNDDTEYYQLLSQKQPA